MTQAQKISAHAETTLSAQLTLSQSVYEYIIPGFQPKTNTFQLPYQHHIS